MKNVGIARDLNREEKIIKIKFLKNIIYDGIEHGRNNKKKYSISLLTIK